MPCALQGLPVVKVCDGDARRFCTRQLGPDGKPAKVKSIDIPVGQVGFTVSCILRSVHAEHYPSRLHNDSFMLLSLHSESDLHKAVVRPGLPRLQTKCAIRRWLDSKPSASLCWQVSDCLLDHLPDDMEDSVGPPQLDIASAVAAVTTNASTSPQEVRNTATRCDP